MRAVCVNRAAGRRVSPERGSQRDGGRDHRPGELAGEMGLFAHRTRKDRLVATGPAAEVPDPLVTLRSCAGLRGYGRRGETVRGR